MDTGTLLGYVFGYFAAVAGVFLLYSPVLLLAVALLVAVGVLKLLVLPVTLLVRLARRPRRGQDADAGWVLNPRQG